MERSRSFHRAPRDISDLEILEKIGDGFFGVVWKARNKWSGEIVAVKKIRGSNVASKLEFLKEAKILKTMRHENLLRLLAMFVVDDDNVACGAGLYLITEFCEGGDLSKRLTSGKELPWPVRLIYALDIAKGLRHLHANHIIHRDLKCGNCLLYDRARTPTMTGGSRRPSAENPGTKDLLTRDPSSAAPSISRVDSKAREPITKTTITLSPNRGSVSRNPLHQPTTPPSQQRKSIGSGFRKIPSSEDVFNAVVQAASGMLKATHLTSHRRPSGGEKSTGNPTSRKSSRSSTISSGQDNATVSTTYSKSGSYCSTVPYSARSRSATAESASVGGLLTGSRVLLADFGLARWYSGFEQGDKPSVMTICGTPWTMAPELMRMKNEEGYSSSCDVFSYGVVLCEIITRMRAVDLPRSEDMGVDMNAVREIAITGKNSTPQQASVGYEDLIQSLIDLAEQCCNIMPNQRPSAMQVVVRLESLVQTVADATYLDLPPAEPGRRRSLVLKSDSTISKQVVEQTNKHQSVDGASKFK